jgi:hypothetical protein
MSSGSWIELGGNDPATHSQIAILPRQIAPPICRIDGLRHLGAQFLLENTRTTDTYQEIAMSNFGQKRNRSMATHLTSFTASSILLASRPRFENQRRTLILQLVLAIIATICLVAFSQRSHAATESIPCSPEPTDMVIKYGDVIACQLETVGDADIYRFSGKVGETVLIQVADGDGSNPFPIAIASIFDPSGALVTSTASRVKLQLGSTGTYTIVVSEDDGSSTTGYNIALDRITPSSSAASAICFGCTKIGAIDPVGDMDLLIFNGTIGDVVRIEIDDGDGSNPFPIAVAEVFDPAANSLGATASQINLTLAQTGTYTILVHEADRDQVLNYNVTLICLSGQCVSFPPSGLSGSVAGMTPSKVVCRNQTTRQRVTIQDGQKTWDCRSAGLNVNTGDVIQQTITGIAE